MGWRGDSILTFFQNVDLNKKNLKEDKKKLKKIRG